MTKRGKRKVGRNEPCPCGSGQKYKNCHGRLTAPPLGPPPEVIEAMMKAHDAQEALRAHHQGQGKPIISAEMQGTRFTAVGNTLHYSPRHKTFIDFLGDYIRTVLGSDWGNAEIAKPLKERHPILQWYDAVCAHQRKHMQKKTGEIQDCPYTGLIASYYGLAYNLYLLKHNAELQDYLIRRLKKKDGFHGAYYETFVSAWFILAGFELSIENEEDSTRSHTEFIATKDGRSYTVEAKTRQPDKPHFAIGNQLYKALLKDGQHPRIVFIDMNVGYDFEYEDFEREVCDGVRGRADNSKFVIKGQPAPPAYVMVTNQPDHLRLCDERLPRALLAVGFKIPDFGHGVMFPSLIDAYKSRRKHADLLAVQDAFLNYKIPITFDGEIPEFAFGEAERRFVIGERHQMDDGVIGTLTQGLVMETEKKAYLTYNTDDGRGLIYTADLSDAEMRAYKAHPETFFGRVEHVGGNIEEPIDMFEWMLKSYKDTPREKILDWMKNAPDIENLKKLPDDELPLVYVERCVYSVMNKAADSPDKSGEQDQRDAEKNR